jgi:hypothetical protein
MSLRTVVEGRLRGARRTLRLIRRSDRELVKVDILMRGRAAIEQDGRQAS